jgi:demethylmenaquinone methyltransferase/2-methoxy-6-polyprenyl-1,4-benzoquinol methylase
MSDDADQTAENARRVRRLFSAIARRYDFLNHLLSGNIDRLWRRACVREISKRIECRAPQVLDVGCGTGDLSLALARLGRVAGCDFCHEMLKIGSNKVAARKVSHSVLLLEGDALLLPFQDCRFDVVASAFVLRNLADARKGLREMRRVIRKGGVLGVMDFCMPRTRILGKLYRFYFFRILPRLGDLISGLDGQYRYLPKSVQAFPAPEELKVMIAEEGFESVEYRLLSGGIAVLIIARA